jgi:cyclase
MSASQNAKLGCNAERSRNMSTRNANRAGLLLFSISIGVVGLSASPAFGQDFDAVEIQTADLGGGVHMLTGRGGNIGVSVGSDGVVLIDDQFAPLTAKILAAVANLSEQPVRYVLNTHWHGDHTGGNENLGGRGAVIVAHDNVRERMSVEQFMAAFDRRVPASPAAALPVVTFDRTLTLHLNGDEIHVFHVDPAHTDGDVIVQFRVANVIHMGDTYFNGMYPFIDTSSGGTIDGLIAAADRVLELANEGTKIIPGHGPLSDKAELSQYRDMLAEVRSQISRAIGVGQTVDEVVAQKPTTAFDAKWGGGFMKPDDFVRLAYATLGR